MKILVLAALIAAVTSGRLSSQSGADDQAPGPWRVGTVYRYDVDSYTVARLWEGSSSGSAFKAHFVIRAYAPGRLLARLENPRRAQVHQELPGNRQLPSDLKYQPVEKLDQPFEINVEGGRVASLNFPSNMPLAQENLLKGLISALQVDLTTYRHVRREETGFDKQTQQGLFKKMETDITGDCETLYNVNPAIPEWRRELPAFVNDEEPIMISKTKDYGHCHHRVAYHFGVPQGSEWAGTAHKNHEEQFIRRATVSRILSGKQGPIYKTETTSTVHVNPHIYGKDKAEVLSYVALKLVSYEQDSQPEWQKPENNRLVNNLLYSISQKQAHISDRSSSAESSETNSQENYDNEQNVPENEDQRQESQEAKIRMRRSAKTSKVVTITKLIQDKASSTSASGSDSDSTSTFVNDDIPHSNEPAYAAMYMAAVPRTDKKQNPINAQKLVQELAQQLQNPNNMPKADFLSKFNILVRIIASMSSEQLALTSRGMEVAKSSSNKVKADIWMIYRDAVTQAGTLPAFQQIKTWIQNKKIQEEEAAQVVASLLNTLRYPTKEIMTQFFRLAMSDEVRQQKYLNSTALIAATRFINMGQVNNETAHSFYPTHMYGRLSRRNDAFVIEEILPRLSQELKEAVQQDDSVKAQVFIKAIGNLGHREILQVFAPYLEGKIPASTYLRTQMVKNLQVLARQKDSHVRAVLFALLRNMAEAYEVRVAAIQNILMARPTTVMMQAMAQMTHSDPSVEVRAVLKSSIESAAELKNPHYLDLARTAQAAKWMLTKQDYGKQYSSKYLNDYNDDESELGILSAFSYIGSKDSVFPKNLKYSIKTNSNGWDQEQTLSTSFSSVQQFVNAFRDQINKLWQPSQKSPTEHKYSADKISQMLNIKPESQNPLEAALHVAIMGQERYFAFSENDIQQLPAFINQQFSNLKKGVEYHYTKVLNQAQVSIMFPIGMGMPFIYKYKVPTVVHIQSKSKGQVTLQSAQNQFTSSNIDQEIQFTYARNIDGSVGFMDTLTDQYASVGIVSKLQVNVPLKMQLQIKAGDLKVQMEPLRADQDNTIVHYSVWPYSTRQKRDTLATVALDNATKAINGTNKVFSIDTRFGQSIGNQFQLQGHTYSSDYKSLNKIMSQDVFTTIVNAFYQKDVALTNFNFRYLGKQSPNSRITFTAARDTYYNQKQPAQPLVASNVADVAPGSEPRRVEMVKRVAAGIKSAKVQVLDMSATYEGAQKHEYVITAAMADSKVDNKIQYAFFAGRNSAQLGDAQVNGVASVKNPAVATLNFLEALKKEMKMEFEVDIKYGQNGNIHVSGLTERSQKYAEQLKNERLGKQCAREISSNDYYQNACHEMLVKAHAPDYFKASVSYKEISPGLRSAIYKAIRMAEYLGYWYSDVNALKPTPEGRLEIESQMFYLQNYMNLVLGYRNGELRFTNVPMPKAAAQAFAIYSPIQLWDRVYNYYSRHQYQPFCTVDGTKIRTFSNRSYIYPLTRSWHVVMQDDGSWLGKDQDQLVVLARRPDERQQEVYISFKSANGKDLELEIQPASQPEGRHNLKVNTNGKKVSEGDLTIYWDDDEDLPLLRYYTQPDGVLMLEIQEGRLQAMYDGQRLVLLARENRNNIRGICGYMNGEARYDYLTPKGLVDKPEHYGASFALNDGDSDPKTQQLKEEAQKLSYPLKNQYTAILPSDEQWRKVMKERSSDRKWEQNVYRSKSYLKLRGQCQIQQQIQYYEDQSEICVTTTPLPACQSHCRGEDYQVQPVQVICGAKMDQQFWSYRDQIRQGENPKVPGVPQKFRQYRVPSSCRA